MSSRFAVATITLAAVAALVGCDRQGTRVTPIDTTQVTTSAITVPANTASAIVTTAVDTGQLDAALRDLDAILRDLDTTITTPEGDQS